MSHSEMLRALQRPLNHEDLPPSEQWAVDKSLGILDWSPDRAESMEYARRRAKMGDKACQRWLAKQEGGDAH